VNGGNGGRDMMSSRMPCAGNIIVAIGEVDGHHSIG
jgi:hypothetical protein